MARRGGQGESQSGHADCPHAPAQRRAHGPGPEGRFPVGLFCGADSRESYLRRRRMYPPIPPTASVSKASEAGSGTAVSRRASAPPV
ncbi:MAG: hypothetical protein BWX88_02724 [Planctomycetes bacterium ADurb.Bin126]|nr:MAG: hypothetical protein BWX88_02724 [Planctomycetes bacterium ADurb.Bin126]